MIKVYKHRKIFITSDQHFDHPNIIKYCERPYESVEEMNEDLILRWNSVVSEGDVVYILGDYHWNTSKPNRVRDFMNRLNGIKILIIGNHDRVKHIQGFNLGFSAVLEEATIKVGKRKYLLSHYPYRRTFLQKVRTLFKTRFKIWNFRYEDRRPEYKGLWLFHGHTHGKYKLNPYHKKMIHIGVDAWNYMPASLSEIEKLIQEVENKYTKNRVVFFFKKWYNRFNEKMFRLQTRVKRK